MVVLHHRHPVGEAEGDGQLHLVLRLIRPVPALPLRLPEHRLGEGLFPRQLGHIVQDPIVIPEIRGGKPPGGGLLPEAEGHPRVHHRLPLHHVGVVVHGDVDVGKDLQIGLPAEDGARLFSPVCGLLVQAAHIFSLFKVEGVFEAVPPDGRVKIFAGILGGTGAKAVQAQGVLIVVPISAVLSAGVQLAEHQLPVIFLLFLIPVHRTAPSLVLHLDGPIQEPGDGDQTAVTLPGLIDGIGHDLKDRVLTALQAV